MNPNPNTPPEGKFQPVNAQTCLTWKTRLGEYKIVMEGSKTGPDPVTLRIYHELAPQLEQKIEMLKKYLKEMVRFEHPWEARNTIWIKRNVENPECGEVIIEFVNWDDIYGEWTITLGGSEGGLNPESVLRVQL